MAIFLQRESDRITSRIQNTATALTAESAQAGHCALHLSVQNRAGLLLATHLPSETWSLANAVEEALRETRRQAYGTNLHCTTPTWTGQRDPTLTQVQANLRIGNGRAGFRDTSERAVFLSAVCNIAPAIAGNARQRQPALALAVPP